MSVKSLELRQQRAKLVAEMHDLTERTTFVGEAHLLAVDVDVVRTKLIRRLAGDGRTARECFLFGKEH